MQMSLNFEAGYRHRDTSKAAAQIPNLKGLRLLVLGAYKEYGLLTADEAAEKCGITVLSARPRVAELAAISYITDSGIRRKNSSGRPAIVWSLKESAITPDGTSPSQEILQARY